jgi:ADP-heptose:LPS heptosyltransferase
MKRTLRTIILLLIRILGRPSPRRDSALRLSASLSALRPSTPMARDHTPRILLVRPDHLGDMLLVTPILKAIKERIPNAHITMMVGQWSADIVKRHPAIDNIFTCPFPGFQRASQKPLAPYQLLLTTAKQLRRDKYDLAINLRPDFWWGGALLYLAAIPRRIGYAIAPGTPFLTHALTFPPAEHATISNLRLASAALQALGYEALTEPYTPIRYPLLFKPTSEEQATINERLQRDGITDETPLVVIHAGTGGAVKLWRPEGWAHIANRLASTPLGLSPINANLGMQTGTGTQTGVRHGDGDRKGREGTSPTSTHPLHSQACHAEIQERCVDDGFTPSRPLRSPSPNAPRIVLTGSPKERPMLEEIAQGITIPPSLMTNLTIGQLAALLARAQLVLGVDNGPLHMAVAQDTPSIRIYGPTDSHIFGPWGDTTRHVVIASTQKCAGCPFIPCGRLDFSADELAEHPCVRIITEGQVEETIVSLVGRQSLPLKQ